MQPERNQMCSRLQVGLRRACTSGEGEDVCSDVIREQRRAACLWGNLHADCGCQAGRGGCAEGILQHRLCCMRTTTTEGIPSRRASRGKDRRRAASARGPAGKERGAAGTGVPEPQRQSSGGGARVRQVEQAMDMPESHRKCHLHAQVQRVTAQWPRKRRLEPACMRRIWPAACLVVSFSGTTVVRHARRDCLVTRQLHAQVSAFSECAGSCTNTRTKSRLCTWCMRPERLSCTYSGAFAASCCDGQAALHSTAQQTQHGGARRATRTTSPATHKPAPAALPVAPTQAGCGE